MIETGDVIETATTTLEYLACPDCRTRYLARAQPPAERRGRSRWFHCHRCGKRVRSADAAWPGLESSIECT